MMCKLIQGCLGWFVRREPSVGCGVLHTMLEYARILRSVCRVLLALRVVLRLRSGVFFLTRVSVFWC